MRIKLEDKPAIRKEVRKTLPFTVSEIGGKEDLVKWKEEQAAKQAAWEAGKQARYEAARARAIAIVTGEAKPGVYEGDKIFNDYAARQAKAVADHEAAKTKPVEPKAEPSIADKALDWFLNIKL